MYLQSAQIWPVCNKGITQFHLRPTHEPYLPLYPSHKASSPSLCLPTKGWPGWDDLGGWLHKFPAPINVWHWEQNPDTVTCSSTNRARRRLTLLTETNAQPLCQTTKHYAVCQLSNVSSMAKQTGLWPSTPCVDPTKRSCWKTSVCNTRGWPRTLATLSSSTGYHLPNCYQSSQLLDTQERT